MTPPEVLHSTELTIFPVLLPQVDAVGAVLLVVPCVIIVALAIVIPLIGMIAWLSGPRA